MLYELQVRVRYKAATHRAIAPYKSTHFLVSATLSNRSSATMGHMGLAFAEGRDRGYLYNATDAEIIRDLNDFYGLKKWGFVIYRCTYGDDAAWSRFMDRLNRHNEDVLRANEQASDFVASYNWTVQEDPALEGATKDEVRRRFRQLRGSLIQSETAEDLDDFKKRTLMWENPRYKYCLHVDSEGLHTVLQRASDYFEGPLQGHSNLIRADESWDQPDFDRFDWEKHETEKQRRESDDGPGDEDDEYDEGEPEIEGSRRTDVGWMKVQVPHLIPGLYRTLIQDHSWDHMYCRPPGVCEH